VHLWVVWLIAAAVLGVAELLTTTLALGLVAAGALAAALASALGASGAIQIVVFVAVSLVGITAIRPLGLKRLQRHPTLRTGAAALVGKTGYVLAEISPHGGRIRIGGEEWSARPYDEMSVIPSGSTVDVLQIEGATALVHLRE
jgi:membrane protein implicated in regulation of membrane protease activity